MNDNLVLSSFVRRMDKDYSLSSSLRGKNLELFITFVFAGIVVRVGFTDLYSMTSCTLPGAVFIETPLAIRVILHIRQKESSTEMHASIIVEINDLLS